MPCIAVQSSVHTLTSARKAWFPWFLRPLLRSHWARHVQPWRGFILQYRHDGRTETNKREKPKDDCKYTYALARLASVKATLNDRFWLSRQSWFVEVPRLHRCSTTSHTPHMHAQNGPNDGDRILQGYTDNAVGVPRITHLLTVTWDGVDVVHTGSWGRFVWGGPRRVPAESLCNTVNAATLTIVSVFP